MSVQSHRIVLVEDNDDDAELVARSVKRFGGALDLLRFRSIPGAIEHLIQEHEAGAVPELVLVDGKIGGLDAGEFFAAAAEAGLADLPFVVLTGSSDARAFDRFLAMGARQAYSKPTEYGEFQSAIEKILTQFIGPALRPQAPEPSE